MSGRLFLSLALSLTAGFAPAPFPRASRQARDSDLARMQGTWAVVEYRLSGSPLRQDDLRVTMRGKRWSIILRGEVRTEWDVRLGPPATPRALDRVRVGKDPGFVMRGIYRFDGDTLTVCYTQGGERPTDFRETGAHWTMVLKRAGR